MLENRFSLFIFLHSVSGYYRPARARQNGSFVESLRQKKTRATAQKKKLVIIQLEFLFINELGFGFRLGS